MKTKIRKASLGALAAVLLAALLMAALPSVAHAAHAAESAAVRVDFTDDSAYTAEGDVTAGEGGARLANGARVAVKESFTSFLCYIDVTSESAFTLSFGGGSLRFTQGGIETSLATASGAQREYDFAAFAEGGIVSIESFGGTITVGVSARLAPEEYLYESVAVYTAENTSGTISVSAEGNMTVGYINVFSLSPTIDIQPDDYDPNDGQYQQKPAPAEEGETPGEGGCNAGIASASLVSAAGMAAAAAGLFAARKKRIDKEKKDEK